MMVRKQTSSKPAGVDDNDTGVDGADVCGGIDVIEAKFHMLAAPLHSVGVPG